MLKKENTNEVQAFIKNKLVSLKHINFNNKNYAVSIYNRGQNHIKMNF